RSEEVRVGRTHQADGGGGTVLLVVSVQDEQQVQRLNHNGVQLILLGREAEAQPQEVFHQVHGVVRVEHRLADGLLVGVSGNNGQLGHEADGGNFHVLRVKGIQ